MLRLTMVLLSVSLSACRAPQHAEYLKTELSFLVPFVDMDSEAQAVRRSLALRKLVVDEELKRDHFIALSATTLDGRRSAVRVITPRGVVIGEDGDQEDLFSAAHVSFSALSGVGSRGETLLAIETIQRNRAAGCTQLYRLLEDGRPQQIELRIERFGSRACVQRLQGEDRATIRGWVSWPDLSPMRAPALRVELTFAQERLDRPELRERALVLAREGPWLTEEAERLALPLPPEAPFSERHARGVERAALALVRGQSAEEQLVAYQSTLGLVHPGSPEAALADAAAEHIRAGWGDEAPASGPPEPAAAPNAHEPPVESDATIIEPP